MLANTTPGARAAQGSSTDYLTIGWALKRALIGICILAVSVGGIAWLLHATIDPNLDARAEDARASSKPVEVAVPASEI